MRIALVSIAVVSVLVASFSWGAMVVRDHVFPYEIVRDLARAIGYLETDSPAKDVRAASFSVFTRDVDAVFLGDSLTRAVEWQDMFPQAEVANRGISGDTLDRIAARLDGVLALDPERVFIMAGINDLYGGSQSAEVFEKYVEVIETLREQRIQVILQSTLHCRSATCPNKEVALLNDMLKKYARDNALIFVDLNEALSNEGQLRREFTYDGTHLTAEAYAKWRRKIAPYVGGRETWSQ